MNKCPHEFPFATLPAVMRGPRVERRRVLSHGSPYGSTVTDVTRLPPCEPTKIICAHLSYSSRAMETRNNAKPTETPTYSTKPPTAMNAHGGELVKPADGSHLNYEGELAVVIGKVCRNVTPDEAWDCKIFAIPTRARCFA